MTLIASTCHGATPFVLPMTYRLIPAIIWKLTNTNALMARYRLAVIHSSEPGDDRMSLKNKTNPESAAAVIKYL